MNLTAAETAALRSAQETGQLLLPWYFSSDETLDRLVAHGFLAPVEAHDLGEHVLVYELTAEGGATLARH